MFKLFLPILFPSWRFFSSIGPSPRISYAFLNNEDDEPGFWHEFRPAPDKIPLKKLLFNLFHNPQWSETLYINTCAERLFEGYSAIREQEIMQRIMMALVDEIATNSDARYLVYRISAVVRDVKAVKQQVTFVSKPALINRPVLNGRSAT